MSWNSVVILICVILAAFGVYREYQRGLKSNLGWRITAIPLAVMALGCLILPVSYRTNTAPIGQGKILLTEGFAADSLEPLKNDSIYTLDKTVKQQYHKAKLITSISQLFADKDYADPVQVFGYGLDNEQLDELAGKSIISHPSPIPDGIVAANWNGELNAGEELTVQVKYKNTATKPYKLVLKGLNTTLDSAIISANTVSSISLKSTPKTIGRVVYHLLAIKGKDTLEQEQLPFKVSPVKPLKILTLSSSPDFETKFLKNWLGENGYSVASRSTISKGKFSQEYINMDQPDLIHLSAKLLAGFDLLIGDLSLLKSLPSAENSALQQEIDQHGLGLIIRADSADKKTSWLQRNFSVAYLGGKQTIQNTLTIHGNGKTGKLTIDPVYIIGQDNAQPLVTDAQGRTLATMALNGSGKIIFTTICNSHNWLLAGNKADYHAFWSTLIGKAARKTMLVENWQVSPGIPVVNKPVQLLMENTPAINNLLINQSKISSAQNPVAQFQQAVTYWPSTYGWQQALNNNGVPYWWFAWTNTEWRTLNAAAKLNATRLFMQQQGKGTSVTKQIHQKSRVAIPKIYFFILFLMAVTYLWAESKFYSK